MSCRSENTQSFLLGLDMKMYFQSIRSITGAFASGVQMPITQWMDFKNFYYINVNSEGSRMDHVKNTSMLGITQVKFLVEFQIPVFSTVIEEVKAVCANQTARFQLPHFCVEMEIQQARVQQSPLNWSCKYPRGDWMSLFLFQIEPLTAASCYKQNHHVINKTVK